MVRRFRPFNYYHDSGLFAILASGGALTIRDITNSFDVADFAKSGIGLNTNVIMGTNSPYIRIIGTEDSAKTYDIGEGAGIFYIRNYTDNIIEMMIDPSNNLVRFFRRIFGEKVWGMDSGSVSVQVGTNDQFGPDTQIITIAFDPNYRFLLPLVSLISIGGTVATSETITVEVYAYDDAGNTYGPLMTYSKTGGTGSAYVPVDLSKLTIPSGRRLVTVVARAKSSASSTNASVSVEVWCLVF